MIRMSAATVAIFSVLLPLSGVAAGASAVEAAQPMPPVERVPANGGLTDAEDGVILPDGRVLVGDWDHGLEGVFQRLAEDFEQFEVDIDTIISQGDLVVTQGRYRATARATGVKIAPRIASFWTVKNGKIAAFQQHVDTLILTKAVGGPA